jgi:hypothetical protein
MMAVTRGPYCTGAITPAGAVPHVVAPASTAARDELMLGHPHPHRRQVEHLPPLHAHLRRVHQIGAAATTRARLVPHRLVRVSDLPQRRPLMPRLPTRSAPALATQRARRGLDERRIRRRRLRRVPAVLSQLPSQFNDLGTQLDHHRPKLTDHLLQLGVLRSKLLIGRTRTGEHPTMINESEPRSTSHAVDLTSY